MKTENYNYAQGVKRVTWPPEHEYQARASSQTRQSPAFQPQHRQPSPHPHYQNGGYKPSTQYRQPSPAVAPQTNYPGQSYQQSPSSNYPQSGYQQHQHQHQPPYQQQQYQQPAYQQGYQGPISEKSQYPDPTYMSQSTPSYLQTQQNIKPPSCTAAFTGGISVGNKAQSQAQSQAPNWSHVQPSRPVHSGYVQPQYNQQQSSQPSFHQSELSTPYAVKQNQYQPQQSYQHQQQQQQQQQYQYQQHQQSVPVQSSTQYQTNQSVQPQPQNQYHPEDNFYRQPSPGVITLRKELPVSQRPPLIYASEPAAHSYGGGGNMRGDQKWPPEEYKKQSEIDNEQRRQLALGPAFRPRRVNKDYTGFFQRHALNATYPGYKAPPHTQFYGKNYPEYPQYQ
ncbi:putative mediator of RNA polymerase II transcription subunit 26 isoform X3 [Contarinia nasturtii]|uniref:putative mediator of RNA polymerase II transcription subunit 26 isoform X3 n=1 Tax=Contarinia nasturtii TaxID=265458 RepID=UPI0012D38398|nr:putative mediator of RNA polymerase II transcription subunit 26 isoform X3 [Contarinia nasturtii]